MASSSKFSEVVQSLAQRLEKVDLQDPEAKQDALAAYLREELAGDAQHHTTTLLPGGGIHNLVAPAAPSDGKESEGLMNLLGGHGLQLNDWIVAFGSTAEKPLELLPCANVEATKNWRCQSIGRMACANCKLVSYCSKECQRNHWRIHKRDCKDPIRSPLWQPAWIIEAREPSFMTTSPGWTIAEHEKQFALGMHIWGNVPAMDTLNLPNNEGLSAKNSNFALAYVGMYSSISFKVQGTQFISASGDLRNVVRTVNELPSDYSGELTVLLNDREPIIVLRNMLLLLSLGSLQDIDLAADLALHLWGSSYIQAAHNLLLSKVMLELAEKLRQDGPFLLNLGENSVMTGAVSDAISFLMMRMPAEMSLGDAHAEMQRVRFEPTRQDRHHRNYLRLNPSHRLSSLEYRRFGIILPFGAANNNFNTANKFLFSPNGRWLADDLATPLESWEMEDVIAAGKAHGVQSADLYGCLYFYLTEQLRMFAKRVRKFKISFKMFDEDARDLATKLRSGIYETKGLPKNTVFDRIDVSNIIDEEYVGIPNVLADWTPFLRKTNRCATILGYSMNWVPKQHNSQPYTNSQAMGKITRKLGAMDKISANIHPSNIAAFGKYFTALYDNSGAFEDYLKKKGTDDAALKAGCKRKVKHSIVPPRIGTPIDAPQNALPDFATEESWYWNVQVSSSLLSERFVEFSRA